MSKTGPTAPAAGVFAGYRAVDGFYDESHDAGGKLRAHYASLRQALTHLNESELKRRVDTCRRLVHEQGITYNVYNDPLGMERPWQLDPLPLVLAPSEWARLEAALIQRARLIDLVLSDCYGAQDLIRSGWLPPALVFAQPDFLRPCHGIRPASSTFLQFYACDLGRSKDGNWWVLSDRTQIPTGAGYALANRLVTQRVLPEPFRTSHVHRLAGFFRTVQDTLAGLSKSRSDTPRIVLLTPGPYNETYFEQAYLARYLGYSLVEGQDLTVRDDRVFLKTLSGLEPVDVILRRVDDDFCDPLELRNDSMLGVPGLLEAQRAGNVAIANSLGSGLLQSPAFLAFLPTLCRHLLGEELKMPSVATWWCGQKSAEEYVLEHLDELYVKPAFRSRKVELNGPPGKDELRRRILFQPHLFAAQELLDLATAPAVTPSGIEPRQVALRVYLIASGGTYKVMPGGLTRVAQEPRTRFISMQRGGVSKDTWVLSDTPVEEVSLLHGGSQAIDLRRVGNNLPSRMADNFFWIGRYIERVDAMARILRSSLVRFSPENTGGTMPVLGPLLSSLEYHHVLSPGEEKPDLRQNPEALEADLLAAVFDEERANSLKALSARLQRLAMLVRDRTSTDLWRVLNQLESQVTRPASIVMLSADAIEVINRALLSVAAVHGLAREDMTRAQAWRFLDMGCRIERSFCLCTMLDRTIQSDEADNPSLLEAILEVADSTITYRSRYTLLPNMAAVYDLVLLDDKNPRSLLFQLNQLVKHFERLPQEQSSAVLTPGQRILFELLSAVRLLDPRELSAGRWGLTSVAAVIRQTVRDLPRLSDAIAVSYFAHSTISPTGSGLRP